MQRGFSTLVILLSLLLITRVYGTTIQDDGGSYEDKQFKKILSTFKFN